MTGTSTPLRVLIIEDDPADAELLVIALRGSGYDPESLRVDTEEDLRKSLLRSTWDVVICKYELPRLDALAALAIVRDGGHDLPFIIVSECVGEELAVRAMRHGAHDFLLKDRLDRLPAVIAREMNDARLRQESSDAQERLRVSEERLRAMFDQAIVGIVHTDLDGRFTLANRRFCQMVGRSIEELVHMREPEIIHPDDVDAVARMLDAVRAGDREIAVQRRYVRPDGDIIWLNAHVSVVSSPTGKPAGLVAVAEDITARRRIEDERERLIADLERTVRVSEMFAGVLGHDLRNPLQTISMAAALLLRPSETSDSVSLASRILRSSDRMERMIDQLLDFTRMRMGMGIPLVLRAVDLADLAQNAIDEIVVGGEESDVELRLEGTTAGRWDRDRLLQLVSNLVANAIDHRTPGTQVRVRIDGSDADRVMFEIQNQGIIPPEILPTIFEPLQTTRRTRRDRASGLGLGLFITRQIARAHGGRIRVFSDVATGTLFVVELPRTVTENDKTGPSSFDVSPDAKDSTPSSGPRSALHSDGTGFACRAAGQGKGRRGVTVDR